MIRITLYKECILNDKYKNVFSMQPNSLIDHTSPFENYLNSLEKQIYEIDNVYQDDMTSLNFKLANEDYSTIYSFNYMKIQSLTDNVVTLTRYAFINSITIGNEIGQISYKIDIWHSFSRRINGLNPSILNGLRVANNMYKKLPVEYAGNNYLKFTPTEERSASTTCSLLVQIQVYNTRQYGDATDSTCQYFLIEDYQVWNKQGDIWFNPYVAFNLSNVEREVERIINLSGEKNFRLLNSSDSSYFKIGKIYIVPDNITNLFNTPQHVISAVDFHDPTQIPSTITTFYAYRVAQVKGTSIALSQYQEFSIQNNFKIKGIGFKSLFFPVEVNGSDILAKIEFSISKSSFSVIFECQNKFVDIAQLFEFFPVTTQLSGEVLVQQRIQREIANLEDIGSTIKRSANLVGSLYGFGNAYQTAEDKAWGFYQTYKETGKFQPGMSQSFRTRDVAASNIVGSVADYLVGTFDTAFKRSARNAPVYNSTGFVKANNSGLLNFLEWFGIYECEPDNEQYVKDCINNLGYDVYKFSQNISDITIFTSPSNFINDGIYYNVIRFGSCDLYGQFPLNIGKGLEQILENGIKIWYHHDIDYALEHDTYAVG